ncbi:MAG: ESX-1 secretion-associated protein [Mycolicibacterium sp.]|uniref:ESX-1 secretion-associated protein n=1 Tax=Mycolicibacterium sp. TaxID=2320850 RepID=UPI003D0A1871
MSREPLQIITIHLRELAAKQGWAATEITAATEAVTAIDQSVRRSHGVIAWSTASELEALQQIRREAGNGAASGSGALSQKLISAADRYRATDRESGTVLEQQVLGQRPQPGPSAPR